jgi:hypothetical protein
MRACAKKQESLIERVMSARLQRQEIFERVVVWQRSVSRTVGSTRHVNMFVVIEARRILRRSQRIGVSKVIKISVHVRKSSLTVLAAMARSTKHVEARRCYTGGVGLEKITLPTLGKN